MNNRIKKTIELIGNQPQNILDIGCAEGYLDHQLTLIGHKVIGMDTSEGAIKRGKDKYGQSVKFLCDDFLKFDFSKEKIDTVLLLETLEHIPNAEEYLKKIYQILSPNGHLIISVPNAIGLCNILYNWKHTIDFKDLVEEKYDPETEKGHIASYDKITLYRLLYKNGFKLVDQRESFKFNPKVYQSIIFKLKK